MPRCDATINSKMASKATDKQRKNSDGRARRLENLKPFPKGVSGNPAGRPKSITLSEALRIQLCATMPGDDERTYAEEIARVLCTEAINGNVLAAREIADRAEGKPKQSVDLDMRVNDWRALASQHGLSEQDVIREARLLIESAIDSSDA